MRPARREDAELLYAWVNSPDSLAAKLLTDREIGWEEHLRWFGARLDDPETRIWIAELTGQPIGQLRVERRTANPSEPFDIDIFLIPEHRGRGIAAAILQEGIANASSVWPGIVLRALVRAENAASARLFRRVGFQEQPQDAKGVLTFTFGPLPGRET